MQCSLHANVSHFISNGSWNIPDSLAQRFPALDVEIQEIDIPIIPTEDQLVWKNYETGNLSFKEAYMFLNPAGQLVQWTRYVWKHFIPPYKSFILWRIMHNRMPTDENLWARGCIIVSICSLCGRNAETTYHLFLECSFAQHIWSWFGNVIGSSINCSSFQSVLTVCSKGWSPQALDIILAALVHILSTVWLCRNKIRFEDVKMNAYSAINLIIANVSLTGNASKGTMSSSVAEFMILQSFKVKGRLGSAPMIK